MHDTPEHRGGTNDIGSHKLFRPYPVQHMNVKHRYLASQSKSIGVLVVVGINLQVHVRQRPQLHRLPKSPNAVMCIPHLRNHRYGPSRIAYRHLFPDDDVHAR